MLGYWTKLFLAITQKIEKSQLYTFLRWLAAWLDAGAVVTVDRIAPTVPPSTQTTLIGLSAAGLTDGARVWVKSVRDWFHIETNPTLVPDGRTIVPAGGSKYWIAEGYNDPSWRQQFYFVDAATGNDENSGANSGQPVKTLAEVFQRRLGNGVELDSRSGDNVDVYIVSADPADALCIDARIASFGTSVPLSVHAKETVLHTGTFTAGTVDVVPATSSKGVVADAAIGDFAPYVGIGAFIVVTASATPSHVGMFAPIVQRLTATTVSTGAFLACDFVGTRTRYAPASGDAYKIVTYETVTLSSIRIDGCGIDPNNYYPCARFYDLDLTSLDAQASVTCEASAYMILVRSSLYGVDFMDYVQAQGVLLKETCSLRGNFCILDACTSPRGINVWSGCHSTITMETQFFATTGTQGNLAVRDGSVVLESVGFFDSAGVGLCVYAGATVVSGVGKFLFGTGNATHGIKVLSGGQLLYSNKPIVNATLGVGRETLVGGTDKQYAAIPFVEPANGAAIAHID